MDEKTILLVDDEQNILDAMSRILHKEDFACIIAQSGKAGLKILENDKVQLVVSDQNMPGMTGIEFLSIVKEMHPDIVRVLLTGQAELNIVVDAINKGEVYRYLNKPINKEELIITIHQCLEHHNMVCENRELTRKTIEQNEELISLNKRLEKLSDTQSRSLELSQEILERLPVAVIGITCNREIALTNEAAKRFIPSLQLVLPGTDISEVLPADILNAVNMSMTDCTPLDSIRFIWNRTVIRAMIEPLNENGKSKGCIIAFETQEIG